MTFDQPKEKDLQNLQILLAHLNPSGLKKTFRPDTVVAAVKIEGNSLKECVNLGDTEWCIIRQGNIVAKSFTFSTSTASTNAEIKTPGNPTTTLYNFKPFPFYALKDQFDQWQQRNGSFKLEEGDVLLLNSDGLSALTDDEKIQSVSGNSAKKAVMQLMKLASDKNRNAVKAPRDHTSVCVYTHSLPPLKRLQIFFKGFYSVKFFNQFKSKFYGTWKLDATFS